MAHLFDKLRCRRKCPCCVDTVLLNAARRLRAEKEHRLLLSVTSRILALALAAAGATACAPQTPPPAPLRLGPAMCKEGPPAWHASDGHEIMYRTWGPPRNRLRAIVVGIPGWNGTAGDIEPLALYLAHSGIRVYSTGVRGQHGDLTAASQRTKGHSEDGRIWERDFTEFIEWVQRRHPDIPLFLYGQSMGSLIAILACRDGVFPGRVKPSGIILHSPAVAMMYASPLLRLCVAELRRVNSRGLLFKVGLISGEKPALTNSAEFDRFWGRSQDRVRPGFTWAFFDETLKLGVRAREAAAQLDIPVLVLTGEKDPIGTAGVGQQAFARLMRRIPAQVKERHRFADGYHDLMHDSNKVQALQCVSEWLERELQKSKA
jgi:acylglycerol lipase